MAASNLVDWRQRCRSDVMQLYAQVAVDIIMAATELDLLIRSFRVIGENHVITLVRDCKTNKAYFGFSYRLRKQLGLPEYRGPLEMRVAREQVQSQRNCWFFDPKTTDEDKRVLMRHPGTCAEHDAYNKFYLDRPNALPQDSVSVSINYCYGQYIAVERCLNCLLYREVMGHVPTDRIHGQRIPLQAAPHNIHYLAQVLMHVDPGLLYRYHAASRFQRGYYTRNDNRMFGQSIPLQPSPQHIHHIAQVTMHANPGLLNRDYGASRFLGQNPLLHQNPFTYAPKHHTSLFQENATTHRPRQSNQTAILCGDGRRGHFPIRGAGDARGARIFPPFESRGYAGTHHQLPVVCSQGVGGSALPRTDLSLPKGHLANMANFKQGVFYVGHLEGSSQK